MWHAEAHPKTSSKNSCHNASLLRFVIIVPIIGKTWCFIYLIPKDSCWRLVFPLTNFQSTFISGAPNNGFLLNTLITPSNSLECSIKIHFFLSHVTNAITFSSENVWTKCCVVFRLLLMAIFAFGVNGEYSCQSEFIYLMILEDV